MEGKDIFVIAKETLTCIDTDYSTLVAFNNLEDAKKKMKELIKEDMSYFENEFPIDDIFVDENEHAIYINVIDSDEYSKIEIKQITLY